MKMVYNKFQINNMEAQEGKNKKIQYPFDME